MEYDSNTTYGIFAIVVALSIAAMLATELMPSRVIFMMVTPSMVVFGGLCLFLGIKHGEYRSRTA